MPDASVIQQPQPAEQILVGPLTPGTVIPGNPARDLVGGPNQAGAAQLQTFGTNATAQWEEQAGPPYLFGARTAQTAASFGAARIAPATQVSPGNHLAWMLQEGRPAAFGMSRNFYHRFRNVCIVADLSSVVGARGYAVGLGFWENFNSNGVDGLTGEGFGFIAEAQQGIDDLTWSMAVRAGGGTPPQAFAYKIDTGVPLAQVNELELRLGLAGGTPYIEYWINGVRIARNPSGWTSGFLALGTGELELVYGIGATLNAAADMYSSLVSVPVWSYVESPAVL